MRLLFNINSGFLYLLQSDLVFISIGSIVVGSLGALKQIRIKRFLAYASINQVGFLFLGLSCCNVFYDVARFD